MENQDLGNPKTGQEYARIFFIGTAMGAADIVPGVSGGTMAFILGIYETLINGIKAFNLDVLRLVLKGDIKGAMDAVPWRFLVVLGLGIVISFLALVRFLTFMLEEHPDLLFAFFFGLVVASIIAIGAKVTRWDLGTMLALVVGAVVAFIIVSLDPAGGENHSLPVLFFSGMVAIMAMVLPGISGSFILLLLGQYEYILNAIKDFNFQVIITVGVGATLGLVFFSRFLSWLLKTYEMLTLSLLTGFMIGSLYKIWPWREQPPADLNVADHAEEFTRPVMPTEFPTEDVVFALVLMLIGFIIVTVLDHLQSRDNPVMLLFQGKKRKATV